LPISLVAHHAFCPRRAWLEAAGEHTDTMQMAVGTRDHEAVDDPLRSRTARVRAFDVAAEELGVVGRCDTVEVERGGALTVVEHKATPVRQRPEVTAPIRLQLGLQVLALREMGLRVDGAAVWFSSHGVRVPVHLTPEDFDAARAAVAATRAVLDAATAPAPLEDDPRCSRCSHVAVCLPDERELKPVTRRIRVADPDAQVVHLTVPGARASVSKGRLVVVQRGETLATLPLERVQGLVVHGNVDTSAALLREVLWRGLTIVWCSSHGRVIGWSQPAHSANGAVRPRQHLASAQGRLDLAREFVAAKLCNQATLLRRLSGDAAPVARLRMLQHQVPRILSLTELYGAEGDGAAQYFGAFPSMLAPRLQDSIADRFPGRQRRPGRDPLNAALNYAYGLLVADVVRALVACGLDPHAGFLHSSARNKPALALDLMEEFRSPVSDSSVLRAFNNGQLKPSDFSDVLGESRLRESGRKALTMAYERRVGATFTHPLFGYEITWRRALEVQARLLLGVLDGTQARYIGIRTR
jgi:CRISPR-associated protein Cas1